ncbi:MAG: hypothetical protein JWQ40_1818 [Segetibacter sp.]|nr:hypothetical protein [Segetibacter sp.]
MELEAYEQYQIQGDRSALLQVLKSATQRCLIVARKPVPQKKKTIASREVVIKGSVGPFAAKTVDDVLHRPTSRVYWGSPFSAMSGVNARCWGKKDLPFR